MELTAMRHRPLPSWTQTAFSNGNSIHGGFQIHSPKKSFGTIYQLTPPAQVGGAWTETTLFVFGGGAEGGYPVGKLAISPNGTLFGVTQAGGANEDGVAFSLVP
jgi:hypothetical protein